jgi:hypothetical protein
VLLAKFADDLASNEPTSVEEVARRWADFFWKEYSAASTASQLAPSFAELRQLAGKAPHSPNTASSFNVLRVGLMVSFCLGGYVTRNRQPVAYEMLFDPISLAAPTPVQLPMNNPRFWGAPNMIHRLLMGCDEGLRQNILKSGKWSGTEQDLNSLICQHALGHAILPIRDAIDFTHACIAGTIKALKFSNFSQICGGPIEIAVITADRMVWTTATDPTFTARSARTTHIKAPRTLRPGSIARRMGATHFLMKSLPKVATEMSLHVLAYNLTRVMNIIGVKPLLAALRA